MYLAPKRIVTGKRMRLNGEEPFTAPPVQRKLAAPPSRCNFVGYSQRRRLHGLLAASYFAVSGVLGLVAIRLPTPGVDRTAMATVSVAALAAGVLAAIAPWERWPQRASLGLVPLAFALIALTNVYGGYNLYKYADFFIAVFVWIGMAHPRLTSVAVAPLAVIAYVLPLFFLPGNAWTGLTSTVMTISVCILVGELIAWGVARVDQIQHALQRERDRMEHLRKRDGQPEAFLSAASHELRTPITVCRGHLEILADGAGQEEIQALKQTLVDELELMERLVEDLTVFARLDDPVLLRVEPLHLESFVKRILAKAEHILGARLHLEPGVTDATLRADPQRMTQALMNLLRNAAQHTHGNGPVRFRVSAEPANCLFEVTDEGGGLPPGGELLVFDPFKRMSHRTGGAGLGLSIVRGIAQAHGGEAGVVNRPGQGATFWVRIPW